MAMQNFIEMQCDNCGQGDFYHGRGMKKARQYFKQAGHIFSKGHDFCSEECKELFFNEAEDFNNHQIDR